MTNGVSRRTVPGLCILAAAIILGVFLLFRQMVAMKRKQTELALERQKNAPAFVPLVEEAVVMETEKAKDVTLMARDVGADDILDEYEKEDRRPGLLQIFRMGVAIPQRKVEGVEYVKTVKFRRQVGTGRILADALLINESAVPVTPRFQIMLFNRRGKFLAKDTVLYIAEDLAPYEKKTETLSLRRNPKGVAFFEVRELD